MKPERILLPIDVQRCPLEVFDLVNGFAKRPEVTVILLHVVNPAGASPEHRAAEEFRDEAQWCLQNLADKYIHPIASTIAHIRAGDPAVQILEEAKTESVDLIILPTFGPPFLDRLRALWKLASSPFVSELTETLIREATCGVFVVLAKTRFNCQRAWERLIRERRVVLKAVPAVSSAH